MSASLPLQTRNPSGAVWMISPICLKLALASLTPTMFETSRASRSVVAASMLRTVRLGTLYRSSGRSTAMAMVRKCW